MLNESQHEAMANADAHTTNAALPSYSALVAFISRLAYPDAGDLLTLDANAQLAVQALLDLSASETSPEQIREIATAYRIETWKLEGYYFEEIERAARAANSGCSEARTIHYQPCARLQASRTMESPIRYAHRLVKSMVNHPNRSNRAHSSVIPTPEEVVAARQAAGLTQTEAAELVHSKLRAWQCWEAATDKPDHRRMHPGLWELFLLKTAK